MQRSTSAFRQIRIYSTMKRMGFKDWRSDVSHHCESLAPCYTAYVTVPGHVIIMHQFIRLASSFSSPAILIIVVWCLLLIGVAIGPIDYPMQPSWAVLALVASGVSLFVLAHGAGNWCCGRWSGRLDVQASPRILNTAVAVTSLIGLAGIGLIALDRLVLSGVSNAGYTELLRCAPTLVEFIEIKRTPLLYVGYLTFSFGFASLVLFLLKGEEIRGWPAALAQLSIVSPVGYAVLYSGRMPVLFAIVLIVSAVLVRISRGTTTFAAWASPDHQDGSWCLVVRSLFDCDVVEQTKILHSGGWADPGIAAKNERSGCQIGTGRSIGAARSQAGTGIQAQNRRAPGDPAAVCHMISAADLNKMVDEAKVSCRMLLRPNAGGLLEMMQESWEVRPRSYVVSAMDSGRLSLGAAKTFLSTYFYLTHGVRVIDMTWRAREPVLAALGCLRDRYSLANSSRFLSAKSGAGGHGRAAEVGRHLRFFPDGLGCGLYRLWRRRGGHLYFDYGDLWRAGARSGPGVPRLATPPLLLIFVLASIFLSPVQGPLGDRKFCAGIVLDDRHGSGDRSGKRLGPAKGSTMN